jgi:hypothetical protein
VQEAHDLRPDKHKEQNQIADGNTYDKKTIFNTA